VTDDIVIALELTRMRTISEVLTILVEDSLSKEQMMDVRRKAAECTSSWSDLTRLFSVFVKISRRHEDYTVMQ
jgi:hypothetical protein